MTALLLALATAAAAQVWIADESLKVRPDAKPPASAEAPRLRLAAAGGECTGAQIVVRGPARKLTATAAALKAAGGAALAVDLFRVATIKLAQPSGPEGQVGEWPDALVPARDALYGEARNAFPVDVPEGRAQSIFVEVCVPRGAGGGRSAGAVRLAWESGKATVPLDFRARPFDLPATPALTTAFGFSGYSAAKGHQRGPEAGRELTRAYDTMALRRGITLFGGTQDPPAHKFKDSAVTIDWADYDAEVGPFLDGTALPGGARFTSVELREPQKLTRPQRRAWRRAFVEHFRQRGWLDRLFAYVEDEPSDDRADAVEEKARELLEDVPQVRRLVTTTLSERLPSVDLYVPLVNCIGERGATCAHALPRERYQKLWWYQSCMSHGCSKDGRPVSHAAFRGWPSYMIDAPATAARAMGALAFAQGIDGELYFDVVYAYDHGDPWQTQWAFGGNGDGTLYYPGTPARIGGKRDVPVESLRLVQIARGLADHAYLSLCAQLGDPALARSEARAIAPSVRGFSRDPHAYAAMRETVGARIETLLSSRKASLLRSADAPR